jgi:hypothetical protein
MEMSADIAKAMNIDVSAAPSSAKSAKLRFGESRD